MISPDFTTKSIEPIFAFATMRGDCQRLSWRVVKLQTNKYRLKSRVVFERRRVLSLIAGVCWLLACANLCEASILPLQQLPESFFGNSNHNTIESKLDRLVENSSRCQTSASIPTAIPFFEQTELQQGTSEQGINGGSTSIFGGGIGQTFLSTDSWSTGWCLELRQSQKYYLIDRLHFPAPPVFPLLKVPIA